MERDSNLRGKGNSSQELPEDSSFKFKQFKAQQRKLLPFLSQRDQEIWDEREIEQFELPKFMREMGFES